MTPLMEKVAAQNIDSELCQQIVDALARLERLTSGGVALPEPFVAVVDKSSPGNQKWEALSYYTEEQMLEYGARVRANEKERCLDLACGYAKDNRDLADAIRKG